MVSCTQGYTTRTELWDVRGKSEIKDIFDAFHLHFEKYCNLTNPNCIPKRSPETCMFDEVEAFLKLFNCIVKSYLLINLFSKEIFNAVIW